MRAMVFDGDVGQVSSVSMPLCKFHSTGPSTGILFMAYDPT